MSFDTKNANIGRAAARKIIQFYFYSHPTKFKSTEESQRKKSSRSTSTNGI